MLPLWRRSGDLARQVGMMHDGKIRSPKPEIRRNSEVRNPTKEIRKPKKKANGGIVRISAFGLLSPSDFGWQGTLATGLTKLFLPDGVWLAWCERPQNRY